MCVDGFFDYSCICVVGWIGKNCDQNQIDCFIFNLCLNGGICVDGDNSYICICVVGYIGILCDMDIDECVIDLC